MKKKLRSPMTFGIPSLFLIFSVLCLTILALLSLSTSRTDLRMSQMSMEQTTAYYDACNSATALCNQADEFLQEQYSNAKNADTYYQSIPALLKQFPDFSCEMGTHTIFFDTPISDQLCLHVEFTVLYPESDSDRYMEISVWKTKSTGSWTPDTRQSVYKGE
jgi:hypothetical protein